MGQVSFSVPQTGQWTVTGSLTGQTLTQTVNVTEKNVIYPIELLFNSAQITVISPVGTSLLLQNGTNQLTKISTGTDVFIVTAMGTWTISGTLEGYTLNSTSVTVQDGGEYQTQLSIQIAALTVNAPSGTIVTVSGNGQQNQQTVTGSSVVFNLTALDNYTISGTNGSFVTSTETVEVTAFQPYSTTLTLSVATITVTTVEGALVQAQNGSTTLSSTAENGTITFETQTFGTWTISGTLSGYTFPQQSTDVQAYQDYPVSLQPSVATLTVTAPDGTYITAQSGDTTYYGLVDGTSADILIYVLGEYTVSGENNGLVSDTQTVNVTNFTDYSTTLTIWSATITVTTPTDTTVTAVNGGTQLSDTAYNGTVVFTVQQTGTWTLSASFDTQTATATVNVTAQANYTATLRVPTIVVTTVSSSVVTCTQSPTVLTKTAQGSKVYFYPPTLGEWVLNATLNQQSSNTVTVDVQENQDYPLMLDYEFATITVTTTAGTEVTAQNGAIIIVQTATDGTAVFEVATMGEWTVSATVNGQALSETVNVTDTINYDVSLQIGPIILAPLEQGTDYIAGEGIGTYFIFAGGRASGLKTSDVVVYDQSLIQSYADPLSVARYGAAPSSVGDYAVFACGRGGPYVGQQTSDIDAYSSNLTHTTFQSIEYADNQIRGAKNNSYALFFTTDGGFFVDSSLSVGSITYVAERYQGFSGASNGAYAFVGGGRSQYVGVGILSTVICYDDSLVQSNAPDLSIGRNWLCGCRCGDYAIFAGGINGTSYLDTVDAYDQSLTRTTANPLSVPRAYAVGTGNEFGAFIAGGQVNSTTYTGVVEFYDTALTRTISTPLNNPKIYFGAATVGQNSVFAGGSSVVDGTTQYYDTVESY